MKYVLEVNHGDGWKVLLSEETSDIGKQKARENIEKQKMKFQTNYYKDRGQNPQMRIVEEA